MPPKTSDRSNSTGTPRGFEAKLCSPPIGCGNNMDTSEDNRIVTGVIFPKCISESLKEPRSKLVDGEGDYAGATFLCSSSNSH